MELPSIGDIQMPSLGGDPKADKIKKKRNELRDEISYVDEKQRKARISSKNLFGTNLRSDDKRMGRLERAVQDMRNEFDSVKPSIKRLTALEGEIQRLINELKQLNNEGNSMLATPSVPVRAAELKKSYRPAPPRQSVNRNIEAPVPKKTRQKKIPPAVKQGLADIFDVRIGEHPGRTRLVMDVNTKTSFTIDIDNNEKIAIIDLPKTSWSAVKVKNFARSNFISSYNVETSENGHILILQLNKSAQVSYKDDLKGKSGKSRRIVIDLIGG